MKLITLLVLSACCFLFSCKKEENPEVEIYRWLNTRVYENFIPDTTIIYTYSSGNSNIENASILIYPERQWIEFILNDQIFYSQPYDRKETVYHNPYMNNFTHFYYKGDEEVFRMNITINMNVVNYSTFHFPMGVNSSIVPEGYEVTNRFWLFEEE